MTESGNTPEESPSGAELPRAERKKKKRKRRADALREPAREPLDASGRERPQFLLSFPHDPELDRLIAAFEAGDYATVRRDAPALAERTDDPKIRDAALELRRRIDPDPLIRYLLLASAVLLAVLVAYAYSHRH